MNKILVVDDADMADFGENLRARIQGETGVATEVNQLDRRILSRLTEESILPLNTELDKFLDTHLDLVLCDINIHSALVGLSLEIADHVRKKNKCCHIILYSGSLHKILDDLLQSKVTAKGREVEVPIRALISANIVEMVSRADIENAAVQWLSRPSILLQFERKLLQYGNYQFNDGYKNFSGLTLSQIAKEVREQTQNGIKYTEELLDQSITQMIDIN